MVTEPSITEPDTQQAGTELTANLIGRPIASTHLVEKMYALYSRHYADTDISIFSDDLSTKTHALLLHDADGELRGFSTLEVYESSFQNQAVRVVYSGDTIVEPRHWGNHALTFSWLRFVGQVKRQAPATPLYWLLIVKGHRTYRYLSTFAYRYTPHHAQTPCAFQTGLLNSLASEKFGTCFDSTTGIARFGAHSGYLNADLAQVPDAHGKRAAVAYFLARNPGYRQGDELVCLCELSQDNMRPLAKRLFLSHDA